MTIGAELPQDMRDLLVRLDQRVKDGFDDVRAKLDKMDKRADLLESRVAAVERNIADRPYLIEQHQRLIVRVDELETARLTTEARIDGATRAGKAVWLIAAAIMIVIGYLGYKFEVAPQPPTVVHKSTETETISVPVKQN